MQLEFLSLIVQGFRSVGAPQTLRLHPESGLHFMRGDNRVNPRFGPNGAGKSSLWNALAWCLTGRTISGLRNTDVVPWKAAPWSGKFKTSVTLRFRVGGRRHEIVRKVSPNSLTLDGTVVDQAAVDRLVGMGVETLTHTVLLGQGEELFFDLKPERRLQVFSEPLALNRWEARADHANKAAVVLEQASAELTGELAGLERTLTQDRQLLERLEEEAKEWEDKRKRELATVGRDLAAARKDLAAAQERYDRSSLDWDAAATEVKALNKEIGTLSGLVREADQTLAREELQVKNAESQLAEVERDLKEFARAKTCPTCGQSITPARASQHKQELTDRRDALTAVVAAGVSQKAFNVHATFSKKLEAAQKHLNSYRVKVERAEDERTLYGPTVSALATKTHYLQKLKEEATDAANPHRSARSAVQKRIKDNDKRADGLDVQIQKGQRRAERLRYWGKGFKDMRLFIMESVLTELEQVTNELLPAAGLEGWEVRYAVERETKAGTTARGLNVTVFSPDNDVPVRWEVWSGGEGQRLRIMGAVALADVLLAHAGVSTNLMVLDEQAHFMAADGVGDVCEFLAERALARGQAVWYIDHLAREARYFTSTVLVTKTAQGSVVQQ